MLDVDEVGRCVRIGLTVVALLLVLRYVLLSTLVEVFRQRVFTLRRELFLLRVDNVVQPTDRSYQLLLRTMNGVIRFAESFSLGRMLVIAMLDPQRNKREDQLDLALRSSPERERLNELRVRLGYELVRHLVVTSPIIWIPLLFAYPVFRGLCVLRRTRDAFLRAVNAVADRPSVRRMEWSASEMLPDDLAMVA